jgi:hypothetical protein
MGIRRRRKKLTSLLANIDRGVRSATLRQIRKQPTLAPADVTEEQETVSETPPQEGTIVADVAPDQWAKVVGGTYYPPNTTGGLGQVELFINQNLELSEKNTLYVSGTEIEWSGAVKGVTYSGSFRPNTSATSQQRLVLKYGTPDWTGRAASTKPNYVDPPFPTGTVASIVYTVTNKSEIPSSVPISFNFRRRVTSYSATTTTGTMVFAANHHFVVGHILDISDLPAPFRDIDGIIKVSAVPSANSVSFTFSKPLDSAITATTPGIPSYANAVVSKFTAVGSQWIGTASTPNKVFVWDGLRWTGYSDALESGLITNDGVAPAAPTNLSLSSYGYAKEGVVKKESRSAIIVNWTAPTENAAGGSLNDLVGYRIWISTNSENGPWITKINFGLETEQTILDLVPDVIHYIAVIAYDSLGLDSNKLTGEIVTTLAALSVEKPSLPILSPPRLGTVTIKWDGEDVNGALTPLTLLDRVEVHASQDAGFTPSESTLIGEIKLPNSVYVASDLEYNKDYYFKFVSVDINARSTDPSGEVSARVTPLVDADLIAAKLNSELSIWPFAPRAVIPGALAAGAINASDVFGNGVIPTNAIAAGAIGANQIAANTITAGQIAANTITSAQIAALSIESNNIKANAITTDKIDAGAITTEKISSDYIYAGTLDADKITVGTMSGSRISGGVIIGTTLQTAASGRRVEIGGTSSKFFDTTGTRSGEITSTGSYADESAVISIENVSKSFNPFGGNFVGPSAWVRVGVNSVSIRAGAAPLSISDGGLTVTGGGTTVGNLFATGITTGGFSTAGISLTGTMTAPNLGDATTQTANMRRNQGGAGAVVVTNQSSIRFKKDVVDLVSIEELSPKKLLELPVRAFRYRDDYQIISTDPRFGKLMPGFIAEEVLDIYPIGVDYEDESEDGQERKVESWNERIIVPGMLALIQELYQRIEILESERTQ